MIGRSLAVLITCSLLVAGCAQPTDRPSPFENLDDAQGLQEVHPKSPVVAPDFAIIPDSEFVYGPSTAGFSLAQAVPESSPLRGYTEEVDEKVLDGLQIVGKISRDYSLNPRLLLALIENRVGMMASTSEELSQFSINPLRVDSPGLFRQLSWLADTLNRGFYTRRVGGLDEMALQDGTAVLLPDGLNDASAAVQYLFAQLMGYSDWLVAVGPLGLSADYLSLFGNPHEVALEPLIPANLAQPQMELPFDEVEGWFFTAGPHSAWGSGAAWGALDFAPDEGEFGCYASQAWVLAVADGLILRAGDGAVLQDLDGDGVEGTGWVVLYMHIAEEDRVWAGTLLHAGERIGHPSCEGGPATGTHLHIARKYNGEWIPADQDIPFDLSGWVSQGAMIEYEGNLRREDQLVPASGYPTDENKVPD